MGTTATPPVTPAQFETLLRFDTGKVANAIERLGVRLKNEGFTKPGLRSHSGPMARAIGYAVTSKVKCADPPIKGAHSFYDLEEWWKMIETSAAPRVAIIQDLDQPAGAGAVLSDVHAHVLRRVDCHAVVTNGSVRNVNALADMGFPAFSGSVGVSHAYVHMVDFACPVQILDLTIQPGDLVYVDVHGMIVLPTDCVEQVIALLRERGEQEARVKELCRSGALLEDVYSAMRNL